MYNNNSMRLKTIDCIYEGLCRYFKESDIMAASISSFHSDLIFKLTHCSKLQNCKCTSFLEWHLFIESNACQKHAWSLESLSVAGQFNIVSLKTKLVGKTFCDHMKWDVT